MTSIPWGEIKPKNQFRTKPGVAKVGVMVMSVYKRAQHVLVHTQWGTSFNGEVLNVHVLREISNLAERDLSVKVTKRR